MEGPVVTMADVARRAGVSVTTVSHALNGTRHVAPETVEIIRKAVAEIGYRRNETARALATATSTSIGLAMSIVTNPYFGELAHQLEERLRQAGFSLVLANTNDDSAQALDVLSDLQSRQVDGLIIVPLEGDPELTARFSTLIDHGPPLLFLDRRSELPVDQVHSDGERAVYDLADHLALAGHRRIGFVTGTFTSMSARDRLQGYERAVATLGLDDDPELVIGGESDEHVAQRVVHRHLSGPNRASALIVANNQMAIGALRAIRDLRLRVPEDIAIVGFDDFVGAELLQPGLTVVKQDVDALAAATVRLLLRRIAEPERKPHTVVIPTTFVHRGSCGCQP